MSAKHHTINYLELPARDITATKSFYETVFGWQFTEWGKEYICFSGAGIEGGFSSDGSASPQPLGVLVVLYSSELGQTENAIKDAGGEIVVPTFEFPGGRRFHFKDPNGNELAVWSE